MNKYLKWYNNIIQNAKNQYRIKFKEIYYEEHHILPKSFGGSDDPSNLVLLTGREHYICHYLLTKFSLGDDLIKMVHAFNMMNLDKYGNRNHFNSILYERNRIKISKLGISKEHREKISNGMMGRIVSDETKSKISNSCKGRIHSKEHREKISKSKMGQQHSSESKKKMSITRKNLIHYKHSGYYITPWGKFKSSYDAQLDILPQSTLIKWCKNNNKLINKGSMIRSNYLKSLGINLIGKSYKELGFSFEEI